MRSQAVAEGCLLRIFDMLAQRVAMLGSGRSLRATSNPLETGIIVLVMHHNSIGSSATGELLGHPWALFEPLGLFLVQILRLKVLLVNP